MTLENLNLKFFKAHFLLIIGIFTGEAIAYVHGVRHPSLLGFLVGLLFSIHVYRQCICILVEEYRRLKSKKDAES